MSKNHNILNCINVVLTLLFAINLYGQSNNWYLGNGIGIDFSDIKSPKIDSSFTSKIPKEAIRENFAIECTGIIHDSKGKVLFYTNGAEIYNYKNEIIENGDSLNGHYSATQCAIIPRPGFEYQYYIITSGTENYGLGIQYTLIDMSNPKGAVIEKNIPIFRSATERIVVVPHSNGVDFWLILHESFCKNYSSFLVTKDGINLKNVVKSYVGREALGQVTESIGQTKESPDFKYIAIASLIGYLEIFEFDNATGELKLYFSDDAYYLWQGPYGLEFAPDGNSLLVGIGSKAPPSAIYQYDLSLPNPKNRRNIIEKSDILPRQLQIGLDNKIYINSESGISRLSFETDGKINLEEDFIKKNEQNKLFIGLPKVNRRSNSKSLSKSKSTTNDEKIYSMPNCFTPNNDGLNDNFMPVWKVNPSEIKKFRMSIFDNIGNNFYQIDNPNSEGWDGIYEGEELDLGNYYWNIEFLYNDIIYKSKGSLLLIR